MESPNFWHVISHFRTTLYWNHIVPDRQGSAAHEIPNHGISPSLHFVNNSNKSFNGDEFFEMNIRYFWSPPCWTRLSSFCAFWGSFSNRYYGCLLFWLKIQFLRSLILFKIKVWRQNWWNLNAWAVLNHGQSSIECLMLDSKSEKFRPRPYI